MTTVAVPAGAVAVAALALSLSACSTTTRPDDSLPSLAPAVPTLAALTQIQLPLGRYVFSPADAASFENAIAILARPCANRFGVTSTLPANNVNLASDALLLEGRYGFVVDPAIAKKFGYAGAPEDRVRVDSAGKQVNGAWNPTPLESEVLTGRTPTGQPSSLIDNAGAKIPEGGCLAEASHQLQGDQNYRSALIQLVTTGLSDTLQQTQADPRIGDATRAWAECMKGMGYTTTDRSQAARLAQGRPVAEERKIASDDVSCAQQVNWFGISYALDTAYQERFVSAHGAELKTAQDGARSALDKARTVISQGH